MGRKRELIVTTTFEPNRLEEQNLSAAYELVLPVRQSISRKQQTNQSRETAEPVKQLGIFSAKTEDNRRVAL
jgi:hypothetical protein